MKIGVNLLFLYEITGIGVFVKNILENLGKIDKENQYIIFTNRDTKNEVFFSFSNFKYVELPFNASNRLIRILFEQIVLPLLCLRYKIDLLFNPNIFNPSFPPRQEVTVIHDLIFYLNKKKDLKLKYILFNIENAIKKSKKIITISEFSKQEILNLFPKAFHKIVVIYEGVPQLPRNRMPKLEKEFLKKFGIKTPYFLYIGLIVPHKNIENLMKAFRIFLQKHPDFELVIAGRVVKELINPQKIISELDLQNKVKLIGYVNEPEKTTLYKNAKAFIFVSTHEGFGLPVLEAQSLGVPVLTSNVTALPEVAGEGALYVDPYNVEEITRGMERIAFDENLRKDLIKKGFENVKRFSWEKTAKELLRVFKEVYESSSSS